MEKKESPVINHELHEKGAGQYMHMQRVNNSVYAKNCPFTVVPVPDKLGSLAFVHGPCTSSCALFSLDMIEENGNTGLFTKDCGGVSEQRAAKIVPLRSFPKIIN